MYIDRYARVLSSPTCAHTRARTHARTHARTQYTCIRPATHTTNSTCVCSPDHQQQPPQRLGIRIENLGAHSDVDVVARRVCRALMSVIPWNDVKARTAQIRALVLKIHDHRVEHVRVHAQSVRACVRAGRTKRPPIGWLVGWVIGQFVQWRRHRRRLRRCSPCCCRCWLGSVGGARRRCFLPSLIACLLRTFFSTSFARPTRRTNAPMNE